MALPNFLTQDPAAYKANLDAAADDHETRIGDLETGPITVGSEARGTNTTAITTTESWIDWAFAAEVVPAGVWCQANGTFTTPAGGAGIYLITATILVNSASANQWVYLFAKLNGVVQHEIRGYATTTNSVGYLTITYTKRLAVGDTIQFFVRCSTGTNTYGGGTYKYSVATVNKISE